MNQVISYMRKAISDTSVYKCLRKIYRQTIIYERRAKAAELSALESRKKQHIFNKQVAEKFFNNNLVVRSGPFAGMKYIDIACGSQLFPKIIGSYEEPIQPWIHDAIKRQYSKIIDIGCAEGYYAVGFALKCPHSQVYAYDINAEARNSCNALMTLNNVNNLTIKGECTLTELNDLCTESTLLVCDIEGFEDGLLDPITAPNLKFVDMIIEAHDCFVPNITNSLINRFFRSHYIEITVDSKRKCEQYAKFISDIDDIGTYLDEVRCPDTRFIKMISYGATCNQ